MSMFKLLTFVEAAIFVYRIYMCSLY